jgi:hypothetical protein
VTSLEFRVENSRLATTRRLDLIEAIRDYAKTESEGAAPYQFRDAISGENIDARTALSRYEDRGIHPLSQWQTHLFEAP